MTTAEVLRAAADRIEKYGWCQGGTGEQGERRCAMRAISHAIDAAFNVTIATDRRSPAAHVAKRAFEGARVALMKHLNLTGGWAVPGWNDAPGRTAEEVIAALRGAAAACAPSP